MTASEKAKELVAKFFFIGFGGGEDKEFAIICVDFHLKEHEDWATSACCAEDFDYEYWIKVKEEINKR